MRNLSNWAWYTPCVMLASRMPRVVSAPLLRDKVSVTALADLVAYGREDLIADRLQDLTDRRRVAERRLASARGLNAALAGLLGGLAAVTTLAPRDSVGLPSPPRSMGVSTPWGHRQLTRTPRSP